MHVRRRNLRWAKWQFAAAVKMYGVLVWWFEGVHKKSLSGVLAGFSESGV